MEYTNHQLTLVFSSGQQPLIPYHPADIRRGGPPSATGPVCYPPRYPQPGSSEPASRGVHRQMQFAVR